MGPPTTTLSSPSAASRANRTCTTTLPPSLAGPGGVFDTPAQKCPPDRGSSDWVTASPAPHRFAHPLAASPASSRSGSPDSLDLPLPHIVYPPTPPLDAAAAPGKRAFPPIDTFAPGAASFTHGGGAGGASLPQAIPKTSARPGSSYPGLETPPHTPDERTPGSAAPTGTCGDGDALALLSALFPRDAARALPHARRVAIDAPQLGAAFGGVVLALPGRPRTLYVDGGAAPALALREGVVALLDLADERLQCAALVLALPRGAPQLGALLHALMYVGAQVVTRPPFEANPAHVLVGLEL